jgi:hypothetical protein
LIYFFTLNGDGVVKSRKILFSVIPAKAGHVVTRSEASALSSKFNAFWMPDQVRHDDFGTFYDFINGYEPANN